MATTKEIYLANFERLSASEIARLAGVSPQRIHQLKQKFMVCKMTATARHKHHCIDCAKEIQRDGRCLKCYRKFRKAQLIKIVCSTCNRKFSINKKLYEWKINHGQKQFFCKKRCQGAWLGTTYGAKALIIYKQQQIALGIALTP